MSNPSEINYSEWEVHCLRINKYLKKEYIFDENYKPKHPLDWKVAKVINNYRFSLGIVIAVKNNYLSTRPPLKFEDADRELTPGFGLEQVFPGRLKYRKLLKCYKPRKDENCLILIIKARVEPWDLSFDYPVEYRTDGYKNLESPLNQEADIFLHRHGLVAAPICPLMCLIEAIDLACEVYKCYGDKRAPSWQYIFNDYLPTVASIMKSEAFRCAIKHASKLNGKSLRLNAAIVNELEKCRKRLFATPGEFQSALHFFLWEIFDDLVGLLSKKKLLMRCANSDCQRHYVYRKAKLFCSKRCRNRQSYKSRREILKTKWQDDIWKRALKKIPGESYIKGIPDRWYHQFRQKMPAAKRPDLLFDKLSSREKYTVLGYYIGKSDLPEIATLLKITKKGAQKLLARAINKLPSQTRATLERVKESI